MIKKIRLRLTLLNACVFFLILSFLATLLYFYMEHKIFDEIDESLITNADRFVMQSDSIGSTFVMNTIAMESRPVSYIMWDAQEKVIHSILSLQYTLEDIEKAFQSSLNKTKPITVHMNDQEFRVHTVSVKGSAPLIETFPSPFSLRTRAESDGVQTIQSFTNVTAEINMLQDLFTVLVSGVILAVVITVLAGFYLANRALIPIHSSWEKQQQFVADASHELRTPLAVIQANTEILLRHPEHTIEQDSRYISTVLKESNRLNKLVNGLLTLARSDSNQLEIYKARIYFDKVIKDVVGQFTPLAEMKDLIIKAEIEEPIEMMGDEERLHQLLIIILDNALKYSHDQGLIQVICRMYPNSVQITVEDTGEGISLQDLPFIFDRFYRGDKARDRASESAGLGLSIAGWIVEKHGGRIRVESKLNVGTKFIITLPI